MLRLLLVTFHLLLHLACIQTQPYPRYPSVHRSARESSSLLNLQDISGHLNNVYESSQNVFTYYDSDLQKHFPQFQPPVALVSVDSPSKVCDRKVIHEVEEDGTIVDASSVFHYYSGEIGNVKFDPTKNVLGIFNEDSKPQDYSVNIWIGEEGVLVTPHYDGVHNMFFQHHGVKTVLISPPVHGARASMFGKMHPLARQSRWKDLRGPFNIIEGGRYALLNQTMSNMDIFIDKKTMKYKEISPSYIEVTLNPGDILYIPPYWLHETIAETCSVSVSVWWDPDESPLLSELLELPIPIESDYDLTDFAAGGIAYLAHLLFNVNKYLSESSSSEIFDGSYLFRLFKNRYYEDFHTHNGRVNLSKNNFLKDEKVQQYAQSAAEYIVSFLRKKIAGESKAADKVFNTDVNQWERLSWKNSESIIDDKSLYEDDVAAIACLKALDYVEEVALFLAEHVLSHGGGELSKAQLNAVAVEFLHQILVIFHHLQSADRLIKERTEL